LGFGPEMFIGISTSWPSADGTFAASSSTTGTTMLGVSTATNFCQEKATNSWVFFAQPAEKCWNTLSPSLASGISNAFKAQTILTGGAQFGHNQERSEPSGIRNAE
jgi:hypothetical protein